ncbi:MAG TPA: hypothetical protein VM492_15975 [Sumerlaeia bacterium]|nr:hypothetical protein [Sumerlaeia bacterium]
MTFLGLHWAIWIVLALYLGGILLLGWWSKRGAHTQEGYLLGNRQFGHGALRRCRLPTSPRRSLALG